MTLIFSRIRGKITLLALLLLCAVGVWGAAIGGKTIYLQAGDWSQDGAWFQIYYWGSSGSGWLTMENVTCDIYKATIPSGNYNGLKFCRTQPGKPAGDWNYVWNQTGDLSPAANENKYDVTWTGGTWYSHTVLPKDTYIYFDNSKTQWANVYMSMVCGCSNKDASISTYVMGQDCALYKMERYCGNIYRAKIDRDAFYSLFSFFADDQRNYDHPYATSAVLHFGVNKDYLVVNPYERTFDEGRQSYVWSGDLKKLPGTFDPPLSTVDLSVSERNPVHRGTTVEISTDDLSQTWRWYVSSNGNSYSSTSTGVSGSHKEKITVTPETSTYYKIQDDKNICNAIYRVEIDIACNGEQRTLLDLNFDDIDASGHHFTSEQQRREVNPELGESVNDDIYLYSGNGKEILDGFYAILANPYYGGRGMQISPVGCHTLSCLRNVGSEGHYWYANLSDHTQGNTGSYIGGMLMANCKEKEEVIFEYTTGKLCGHNLFMTFSAWFANATSPELDAKEIIPINAQIRIIGEDDNEVAHIDVKKVKPNVSHALAWKQGSSSFFSGNNDYLKIQIVNYGESGTGNDILIDDIKFTACVPTVDARPATSVDCGESTTLTVDPSGIAEIFATTPYYLWQRWNYSSEEWVSVADAASPGGSGVGNSTYSFATEEHPEGEKPKFRVIMSNDRAVAHQVGGGNPPDCVNFAVTDDILVDCKCVPVTIEKTSGDEEQTVCEGNAISNVVYTTEGNFVKGISVVGLPEGMTAAESIVEGNRRVTISGNLPITGEDQDYTITLSAVGTTGISCPSNELELVIHAKEKPSLTLKTGDRANQFICEKTNDVDVDALNDYIVDAINYTWGGSATDVSITQSPAPTASQAGLDVEKTPASKTITLSGSPARTTEYTIRTTGQNSVCAAAVKTGTITVGDVPGQPLLLYRQIQ